MTRSMSWTSWSERRILMVGTALITLLTLVLFGRYLFGPAQQMMTSSFGDIARYYVFSRFFGFQELAGGNLPLWNPHSF